MPLFARRKSSHIPIASRGNPFSTEHRANAPPAVPSSSFSPATQGISLSHAIAPTSASTAAPTSTSEAPPTYTVVNPLYAEDSYALLARYDTVLLVDDSGSMAGNLWEEASSALAAITSICAVRDQDGIDLYFLNHRSLAVAPGGRAAGGYYNLREPRVVSSIFRTIQPYGSTFTAARIESILGPYVQKLSRAPSASDVKGLNLIVITDGEPSDDPESVIVQYARKLDKLDAPLTQVGIQFFQIGSSPEARKALEALDDDLEKTGIRDMVDTSTFNAKDGLNNRILTAQGILKVVLGAIHRRYDRQKAADLCR